MDYADENKQVEVSQGRWSLSVLTLAVAFSLAAWFVMGLATWRMFSGWYYGP
jgi:hypothetical protein